jgi:PAS domain S-box-containing protein
MEIRCVDLRVDPTFFKLLADSYLRLLGKSLTPDGMSAETATRWLYEEAPFGILAHNTDNDPTFVYGNRAAQNCFEYTWDELTSLRSRFSAEAPDREERRQFLENVQRDGFVTGYRGLRVTKSGKRFWIQDATIWQLTDEAGIYRGQAAMLPHTFDA